MSNDTIKKIDEAIEKIKMDENNFIEKEKEVGEDTDTKIFDNREVFNDDGIDKTKEFDEVDFDNEDKSKDEDDLSIYIFYFTSLIIVVVLVITFILFFYK